MCRRDVAALARQDAIYVDMDVALIQETTQFDVSRIDFRANPQASRALATDTYSGSGLPPKPGSYARNSI